LREAGGHIYLANHSLGRPLDRTSADVEDGLSFWYRDLDRAWADWQAEMVLFRARVATLINAPGAHCIVPKASAGQGLRAVLNCHDAPLRVIATANEFNSIDLILKAYAARGRIKINWIRSRADRRYRADDLATALHAGADLLVASMVFFDTGQLLTEIDAIARAAKAYGVGVLVDLYHATGALPVDVQALDIDFAIGARWPISDAQNPASWSANATAPFPANSHVAGLRSFCISSATSVKTGRLRSTISVEALRQMRKWPGTSSCCPGSRIRRGRPERSKTVLGRRLGTCKTSRTFPLTEALRILLFPESQPSDFVLLKAIACRC
jgi:hypothetical protein